MYLHVKNIMAKIRRISLRGLLWIQLSPRVVPDLRLQVMYSIWLQGQPLFFAIQLIFTIFSLLLLTDIFTCIAGEFLQDAGTLLTYNLSFSKRNLLWQTPVRFPVRNQAHFKVTFEV